MADPLSVPCPDCLAPADTPCHTSIGYLDGAHADRRRTADLRALEHGTCALCGQPMVRGTVEDSPVDAWHPDEAHAAACPPIPDPRTDWNGYAEAVNAGAVAGHPGLEHFRPAPLAQETLRALTEQGRTLASEREDPVDPTHVAALLGVPPVLLGIPNPAPICPECTADKHGDCDGTAWDTVADGPTSCACSTADHPGWDPPPPPRVATSDPFTPNPPRITP